MEAIPRLVKKKKKDSKELVKEVIDEEIVKAVFEMGVVKTPIPDGYNDFFYQKYWKVVKESVLKVVRSFLHNGNMLMINIVLIKVISIVSEGVSFFFRY